MIYIDSSVALAHLLTEARFAREDLWQQQLVSSRLLEYEVWNRIHARRLDQSHGDAVRALIGRLALLELSIPVLARALDPFRIPVRTLDAPHLASMEFLRLRRQEIELASYDARLISGARALHIPLSSLPLTLIQRVIRLAAVGSSARLAAGCLFPPAGASPAEHPNAFKTLEKLQLRDRAAGQQTRRLPQP